MTDRLQEAARAYRAALAEDDASRKAMAEARAQRQVAIERLAEARAPLAKEIVAEAGRGVRQREILDRIEHVYTREQVRRICKDARVTAED